MPRLFECGEIYIEYIGVEEAQVRLNGWDSTHLSGVETCFTSSGQDE